MRFNELHRFIGNVSFTALSTALKELDASGLVERKEFPQIPPRATLPELSRATPGLMLSSDRRMVLKPLS
ncbi:MAG: winged helix-turn-helix transcriptional regulator [Synergistaceae bacterium]|nr:winged helix-turn-helix transcriptional regulator [Synergistaceae bacterium]